MKAKKFTKFHIRVIKWGKTYRADTSIAFTREDGIKETYDLAFQFATEEEAIEFIKKNQIITNIDKL